jgi:asparagine synthase (glutamine-hydrolysing)
MRAAIGGRDRLSEVYASIYSDALRLRGIDRELLFSYRLYLPDQLLVKTDRASMAHALEMRSPLLDRDFIDLCARLPQHMKISGGVGKRLLRKLLALMVPGMAADRPKHGFTVPVSEWIRGPLRGLLMECTRDPRSFAGLYLNVPFVRTLVDDHLAGRRDHGHRLFALVMLELWHRRYINISSGVSDYPRYAYA